ncbi:MAG: PilW family protein [Candidatus Aminicenantales bacterium]
MKRDGFTLIECLLGLALSLFVISTGLEFFIRAEKAFLLLKEREEAGQAALAALDRMRIDLLHAGRGLSLEIGLGLVAAAEATAAELRTMSLEKTLTLAADAQAGDTRLPLESTADITAGQQLTLRGARRERSGRSSGSKPGLSSSTRRSSEATRGRPRFSRSSNA